MTLIENPFGSEISSDDILDTLSFFDNWEERYKYIIDLGKQLPAMPESKQTDEYLLRGCQSQVWIDSEVKDGVLYFEAYSDAFIVRGLLGVDRKSTRLNSSHVRISYAVFCLKKKN